MRKYKKEEFKTLWITKHKKFQPEISWIQRISIKENHCPKKEINKKIKKKLINSKIFVSTKFPKALILLQTHLRKET